MNPREALRCLTVGVAVLVTAATWPAAREAGASEQISDNGSTMTIRDFFQEYDHATNYHFRGQKSDAWDGGHHIPFIARWPARVKPGSICDDTVCLADLMATLLRVRCQPIPA